MMKSGKVGYDKNVGYLENFLARDTPTCFYRASIDEFTPASNCFKVLTKIFKFKHWIQNCELICEVYFELEATFSLIHF